MICISCEKTYQSISGIDDTCYTCKKEKRMTNSEISDIFADVFYVDLNNPFGGAVKAKKHLFRDPKIREMQDAGFAIEKHGSWYEVWHNKLMPGTTDEYRTLREIDTDYYLGLVK